MTSRRFACGCCGCGCGHNSTECSLCLQLLFPITFSMLSQFIHCFRLILITTLSLVIDIALFVTIIPFDNMQTEMLYMPTPSSILMHYYLLQL